MKGIETATRNNPAFDLRKGKNCSRQHYTPTCTRQVSEPLQAVCSKMRMVKAPNHGVSGGL